MALPPGTDKAITMPGGVSIANAFRLRALEKIVGRPTDRTVSSGEVGSERIEIEKQQSRRLLEGVAQVPVGIGQNHRLSVAIFDESVAVGRAKPLESFRRAADPAGAGVFRLGEVHGDAGFVLESLPEDFELQGTHGAGIR